jgi:hypothetical protein
LNGVLARLKMMVESWKVVNVPLQLVCCLKTPRTKCAKLKCNIQQASSKNLFRRCQLFLGLSRHVTRLVAKPFSFAEPADIPYEQQQRAPIRRQKQDWPAEFVAAARARHVLASSVLLDLGWAGRAHLETKTGTSRVKTRQRTEKFTFVFAVIW